MLSLLTIFVHERVQQQESGSEGATAAVFVVVVVFLAYSYLSSQVSHSLTLTLAHYSPSPCIDRSPSIYYTNQFRLHYRIILK